MSHPEEAAALLGALQNNTAVPLSRIYEIASSSPFETLGIVDGKRSSGILHCHIDTYWPLIDYYDKSNPYQPRFELFITDYFHGFVRSGRAEQSGFLKAAAGREQFHADQLVELRIGLDRSIGRQIIDIEDRLGAYITEQMFDSLLDDLRNGQLKPFASKTRPLASDPRPGT